jgi:hypothetical protein
MGEVVFDKSMSLDGFITGPNEGIEHPLGCLAQSGQFTDRRFRVRDYEPGK